MIGSLGTVLSDAANRVFSTPQAGVRAVSAPEPAKAHSANSPAVEVSISREGRKAAGLLASLPPLSLDPALHIKEAQSHLKQIMSELGIPASTDLKIHSKGDGTFRVEADHPKAAELESMINDGTAMDLRNSLIGAHNGTVMQRIAKAMATAMKGTEQSPGKSEQYSSWVQGIANEAMSMQFEFSYSGDKMTGTLLKQGSK